MQFIVIALPHNSERISMSYISFIFEGCNEKSYYVTMYY